jgi:sugar transferase (PEP-CTERM system associated)
MICLFNHYCRRQTLLHVLSDVGLIIVAFLGVCWLMVPHEVSYAATATHGLSLLGSLLVINTASGLYRSEHYRSINQLCARAALALLLALPAAYVAFSLSPAGFANLEEMRWLMMVCVAGVIAHRVYAIHADRWAAPHSRILIFGAGSAAQLVARAITVADPHVEIVGYVPGPNETTFVVDPDRTLRGAHTLKDQAVALGITEIVVAVNERRGGSMPLRELLDCKIAGVKVSDLSTYFEKMLGQIRIDQLHAGWLIFGNGFSQGAFREIAKRLFDIVSSIVLLALAAPIMLIAAACIKVESRGPVFYRQERVGQDGATFSVLKFRSMRVDAEPDGKPQWACAKDDRVTRVGAFIRRFRIDEFPQLLNVLSGRMSLVGPRPERPFFVEQLTREIPFYAVRHSVKPGVTGWAQVRYQYGATVADAQEKLQYDLYYVKNHSLFLDVVVLLETIGVVVSGNGAR